jgi:hypothetical protein
VDEERILSIFNGQQITSKEQQGDEALFHPYSRSLLASCYPLAVHELMKYEERHDLLGSTSISSVKSSVTAKGTK